MFSFIKLKFNTLWVNHILITSFLKTSSQPRHSYNCSAATLHLPPWNGCHSQHSTPNARNNSVVNFFLRLLPKQQLPGILFFFFMICNCQGIFNLCDNGHNHLMSLPREQGNLLLEDSWQKDPYHFWWDSRPWPPAPEVNV